MIILKVIARMLDYPTQEMLDNGAALIKATQSSREIPPELRQCMVRLISNQVTTDLYDLQSQYDGLFERGRYVSLLIFEHVHGESRARGQAMVDLLDMYQKKGFDLDSRQMPDYLPLFLEFMSEQDDLFAREWLADVGYILALLEERLKQRNSDFNVLFTCLLIISGAAFNKKDIQKIVRKEQPDTSMEAIDKAWEDKEVRFDDPVNGSCASKASASHQTPNHEVPLVWQNDTRNK